MLSWPRCFAVYRTRGLFFRDTRGDAVADHAPGISTTPTFVVSGVVVDESANPVVGVSLATGDATAINDADGLFLLEVSAPGPISVSKIGWSELDLEWTDTVDARVVTVSPITVRGLRVGASAAGDDESFNRLLNLADITAVNALVFDTKQEGGWVLYDTNLAEVHEIGAVEVFYDPAERIEQAHEHGLYTITRIVTFGGPDQGQGSARGEAGGGLGRPS